MFAALYILFNYLTRAILSNVLLASSFWHPYSKALSAQFSAKLPHFSRFIASFSVFFCSFTEAEHARGFVCPLT